MPNDGTSAMMQIDGTSYGQIKTVRGDMLDEETGRGWKLIAIVTDTLTFNVDTQIEDEQRGGLRWTTKQQIQPASLFVLGRNEDDVIAKLRQEQSQLRVELQQSQRAYRELKQSEDKIKEIATKTATEHTTEVSNLQRKLTAAEKARDHHKANADSVKKQCEQLFACLKSLLSDDAVNNAIIAAITVSAVPTAKQMIVDLMELRETLGVKTKAGDHV